MRMIVNHLSLIQVKKMSKWDKRIERNIRFNKYLDEPDRWKLYNECAEKLEAIRSWLLDEDFQTFRDNIPDHADYPRFGDFYEVHSEWVGDFLEWLEKCPMRSEAILGKTEEHE